jgi:hypothetical protein
MLTASKISGLPLEQIIHIPVASEVEIRSSW